MTGFSKLPPECDDLCHWRKCANKYEDKGASEPGRIYVCMTHLLHGCPRGPVVNGTMRRPMPDLTSMVSDMEDVIQNVKATNKVKGEMRKMMEAVRFLSAMILGEE